MKANHAQKKKTENYAASALLYTLSLALLGLVIIVGSAVLIPFGPFGRERFPDEGFFMARIALAAINIILASYLLFIHIQDYLVLRSSFTIGIIAFLFVFLLYALSSFPPVHILLGLPPLPPIQGLGLFAIVPMFLTAIAMLIFLKVSET
jgi:hypothetical protein